MPSHSKQQQKLMGIVHALQTGDMKPSEASPKAQKMAKSMKKGDVTDYASTKHKGLPKKVKKEGIDGAITDLYAVQIPYSGCTQDSLVTPFNPIQGIPSDKMSHDQIHAVYPDQEMANSAAKGLYEDYCNKEAMLEEKKSSTSDKIKKAITQLEKKHKEHINLAKEDPKNAKQHRDHIAKITSQIDDLMGKLERIEKSKKELDKKEETK
jgi:hypothetical protein